MSSTGENHEIPGYLLHIKSLGIGDLGPYTCQAFNGVHGSQAVSFTTVLKVQGPIDRSGLSDKDRRIVDRYVVDAPIAPSRRTRPPPYDPNRGVPGEEDPYG